MAAALSAGAARTFRPAGWVEDQSVDMPGAGQLVISQRLVTDDVFSTFQNALDMGRVAPDLLLGRTASPAKITAARAVIQECLRHSAARAALYYTLPDVAALIG